MGVFYVPTGLVRPKVIALLQVYETADAVAEVVGIPDYVIRDIREREYIYVTARVADKIDAAYKKSRNGRNRHGTRSNNHHNYSTGGAR